MTCRRVIIGMILFTLPVLSQSPEQFVTYRYFNTRSLAVSLKNDGRLGPTGIRVTDGRYGGVFDHGLIVIGYRDGELVGTAPLWCANYTPGPIINGKAAIQAAPQDSARYRTYIITKDSKPGETDFDQWPAAWGAPMHNGRPKLVGDVTAFTVYNDAHPEVHSWTEKGSDHLTNTNVEIHETVWGYDRPGVLGQTLFFQWDIINKNSSALQDVILAHWNDIDLSPPYDRSYFTTTYGFGYVFANIDKYGHNIAGAYAQLQGPYADMTDDMGLKYHFPVTAYWGLEDDGYPAELYGGQADNLQQLYYHVTGRRFDGSPIVNPVTGDTTTFTFTGDPVSQSGWIQQGGGGGCGGISAAGPVYIAPGDTQRVVYAFIYAEAKTATLTWNELFENYQHIHDFYHSGVLPPGSEEEPAPLAYSLQNIPNPFTTQTTITYDVPVESVVSITLYNSRGQFMLKLVNDIHAPGHYAFLFSPPASWPSGIYMYQLTSGSITKTKKMTYIR